MASGDFSALTDRDLVHLCQHRGAKDDRPFAELFRRYQREVWRICYGFTGNAQDAEDLAQEVFYKVHRALPGFEGRSEFRTWLYRIAVNAGKNALRQRRRQPPVSDIPAEDLDERLQAPPIDDDWMAGQSHRERLEAAVGQLHPDERQALILREVDGLPYTEIARQLDIGLSAAKMRVLRARLAFRQAMEAESHPDEA